MLVEDLIKRELNLVADNIRVFIGKDKETEKILKNMNLSLEDISDDVRKKVEKASKILKDTKKSAKDRIKEAMKILEELKRSENVPAVIRNLIISNAINRLREKKKNLEWKEMQEEVLEDVEKITADLNLLISDDRKTKIILRNMGIEEVPPAIRELAKRAKETLEDRRLDAYERATRAADILVEPLQPAIYGEKEEYKNLQPELRGLLWEIAFNLIHKAKARVK